MLLGTYPSKSLSSLVQLYIFLELHQFLGTCHLYLFPIPIDRCVIWDDSPLLGLCNVVILTQYLVSRALVVLLSRKLARLWSLVSMKSHWLQASATWLLRGSAIILLIRDFSLVCHFWCLCSFLLVVLFVWHELAATTCNRVVALNNNCVVGDSI